MTLVKCDRCGNEIRSEIPEWYEVGISRPTHILAGVRTTCDLCRDCREALIAWIREGSDGHQSGV